jgi:hypothetical protein
MSTSLIEFTVKNWFLITLAMLSISPIVALVVLNSRLKPGKVPHQAEAVQSTLTEASRSLRQLSRGHTSMAVREEAHRKLLQFQSTVRFSETPARRSQEMELIRMLQEAARYGITVTPDESMVGAA